MFVCFVIFQEDVLTNLCSLVGQSPPAFLMTPKTRSPKELTTAKSTTGVTRVVGFRKVLRGELYFRIVWS